MAKKTGDLKSEALHIYDKLFKWVGCYNGGKNHLHIDEKVAPVAQIYR